MGGIIHEMKGRRDERGSGKNGRRIGIDFEVV
jgi:hypothetical protein